jgi:hypothetical membrane protein
VTAVGGIVGPIAFVSAWVATGAVTSSYSPVHDAISRLAALHAPTRVAMSAGFVAFGVGLPTYAYALRRALPGPAWIAAAVSGLATLGVAAAPLDRSAAGDSLHGVFAGIGYVALAATPLLAAVALHRTHRRGWARVSAAFGAVAGAGLALTLAGPAHGLFQRAGLTVADVWVVASAIAIVRARPESRL